MSEWYATAFELDSRLGIGMNQFQDEHVDSLMDGRSATGSVNCEKERVWLTPSGVSLHSVHLRLGCADQHRRGKARRLRRPNLAREQPEPYTDSFADGTSCATKVATDHSARQHCS